MAKLLLAAAFCLLVGWIDGYRFAHKFVALECQRLGGFFVNDAVFVCQPANDHQHP